MNPFVVLQAAFRSEPFATLGARKRSLSCMSAHVNRKVGLTSVPENGKVKPLVCAIGIFVTLQDIDCRPTMACCCCEASSDLLNVALL